MPEQHCEQIIGFYKPGKEISKLNDLMKSKNNQYSLFEDIIDQPVLTVDNKPSVSPEKSTKAAFQTIKKYPTYKDSGAAWLGEIPVHWEAVSLGSLLELKSDKNHPNYQVLSVYREYGVIPKDSRDDNHNATSLDTTTYKAVEPGDLVVNKMKAWQGSMGISAYKGIVSPAYITCRVTSKKVYSEYLHRLLRSDNYIGEYNRISYGVRVGQWDMHYEDFKKVVTLLPPLEEQTAIATFLDQKTAQIDKAVAIKEKQIELLKERRQILIHNAVTRGLNPNASMKDSGVEWIGEIPAHWQIVKNHILFQERNQPGNESLPLLTVSIHSAVSSEELNDEENLRGKIRIEDKSNYKLVKVNDIVFNMMRAWQGAIGAVRTEGMVSPAYIVAKPKGAIDADFFEYQYRTKAFIQQMDRFSKGITDFRKRLYWDEFKQLKTILPPISEQTAISKFIAEVSQKIETAISIKEKEIEKLKEYKTTLINSVVTGKIKVS
ncbi:restriction endonuclease subunit S [Rhodocytophaga rosea]|uniref:Restriction endonuclease subunit S n=1 Tax=Rhodocytophaga rosea TaxID=2704465 RepID=A0A6C0GBT6_9BACT|nr:restriction endonuclease subunit S [Rhodocytophaga rosea]QHT65406.1 restriction endonuclease subunit S [Rhodocytophaga rosea]